MRHRFAIFGLVLSFCVAAQPASAVRYASIIVDERSGTVLHAANPDRRSFPASLTKMMTLYMVFEALKTGRLSPDKKLTVSKRASRRPKSKLWLKKGQKIKVSEVIGALITKSANDAATVIAEEIGGGSEARFAQLMTARARQLGMTRTTFRNASGLPDRHQVSTARDMAKLAMALRRDFPKYFKLFSMKSFKYRGREYRNHNRLLGKFAGTDGIKTGYVRASGYNIVISIQRERHRLIAVVFGGKSASKRDRHIKMLLRRTYRTLAENDRIEVAERQVAAKTSKKSKNKAAKYAPSSKRITIARIAPETSSPPEEELAGDIWSVQVGAFDRFAPAHLAAGRAARLAPMLRGARVVVESGTSSKRRIYRARLAGLSEGRAIRACRTLKKKKMTCLVLREESGVAQGDR
ncbi:MAG: D-alanyl-D-alanine carboxypeptidase [Rhodospirillaceae bacterium]|jgi:D-alanyl-D-alanine carboxypeptidase|nr:D-alanyl-D-alanine carboxypeptidase [Rhodospirillaceae bacterium]MBT5456711.1 D-alanyl-D-alanine carboxypeptidase [Rhodospirillaceae bacterium]